MRKVKKVGLYIVVLFITFIYLTPMLLIVLNSLKNTTESSVVDFTIPEKLLFENYLTVFQTGNITRGMINGFIMAFGITIVTILVCSMAAFVIERRMTRVTTISYKYLLTGMIAPFAFIPAIKVLQMLGLYNTYLGLILVDVSVQIPFTTLLFVGFIKGIPRELDEAAVMDGCPAGKLFFKIIFPTLKPIVATNVVLLFTYGWNEFQNVLFLIPDTKKWTMPMTVFNFQGLYTYQYNLVCADLMLAILPVFIVYLATQKYIIAGMTAGAVKG